jgi:hypothetical protein
VVGWVEWGGVEIICSQLFEDFHISAPHLNLFQIQCWHQNQRKQ